MTALEACGSIPSPVEVPGRDEAAMLDIEGLSDVRRLGSGGSGVLFRAREEGLDREVAVKVIELSDADARRRFERERALMGRLSMHPGIVAVYRSGIDRSGRGYLVMPFVRGGSLQELIDATGGLPWEHAIDLVAQVATAVQAAHQKGVLHRDITPNNILLGEDGRPLLADLGLARLANRQQTIEAAYTPSFAAPEAVTGDPATTATDVYGLACLLYTAIMGRAPFEEDGRGLVSLAERIVSEPAPSLPTAVPPQIRHLVERGLAKAPEDRPALRRFVDLPSATDGAPRGRRRQLLAVVAGGFLLLTALTAVGSAVMGDPFRGRSEGPDAADAASGSSPVPAINLDQSVTASEGSSKSAEADHSEDAVDADAHPTGPRGSAAGFDVLTIAIGGEPQAPVLVDGAVWLLRDDRHQDGSLLRIDPTTGAVLDAVRVGRRPRGLAVSSNELWIHAVGDGRLIAVDTAALDITTDITLHGGFAPPETTGRPVLDEGPLVSSDGTVWVSDVVEGEVHRVTPDGRLERADLRSVMPGRPVEVGGEVWVPTRSFCRLPRASYTDPAIAGLGITVVDVCDSLDRLDPVDGSFIGSLVVAPDAQQVRRVAPGETAHFPACVPSDPQDCISAPRPITEMYDANRGDGTRQHLDAGIFPWLGSALVHQGRVWLAGSDDLGFDALEVDPDQGLVAEYSCQPRPRGSGTGYVAPTRTFTWVVTPRSGTVCAIASSATPADEFACDEPDPECVALKVYTPGERRLQLGSLTGVAPVGDGTRAWIGDPDAGTLLLLDAQDDGPLQVLAEFEVGVGVQTPTLAEDGTVWAASLGRLTRLTPRHG